jgi:hypothetical protein
MGSPQIVEGHERESRSGAAFAILPLLPILYVLSIGPVGRLVRDHSEARDTVKVAYVPIIWLHDNTFLRRPLEAYAKLWGWE